MADTAPHRCYPLQLREAVATFAAMPPRAQEDAFFEGCCHAQLSALAGGGGSGL